MLNTRQQTGAVASMRWRRLSEIWRAYHYCSITKRIHLVGRYVLCPYEFLLSVFPPAGQILDIGCGEGLLLFLLSKQSNLQGRTYVGIDLAEDRLAIARRARFGFAEFHAQHVSTLPSDTFDCVAIVDVLYLLPIARWMEFLQHVARILRKDGLLIVKEVTNKPRWKHWIAYVLEILAIKVVGMSKGDKPHIESIDTYRASIEATGVNVFQVARLDAWRPHAHVMLIGRKGG